MTLRPAARSSDNSEHAPSGSEHRCQFRMGPSVQHNWVQIHIQALQHGILILSNARLLRVQNGTEVYFKDWKYAFKTVPNRVSTFIKINV